MDLNVNLWTWAVVLILFGVFGAVSARRVRAATGRPPGGTTPIAWGLLTGLLPPVGLLLMLERIVDDQSPTTVDLPEPLAATVLPR